MILRKIEKKLISVNKKARFNFFLKESFEAGIVLLGSEVKSIRKGKVNIEDSYIVHKSDGLYLTSSYIGLYEQASIFNHETNRDRKLLLTKKETNKILGNIKKKGCSVVPCSIYFNSKNIVKLEIAICIGKKLFDKRQVIKERDWNRKKSKELKHGF